MVDFLKIQHKISKSGGWEIFPQFEINNRSKDLMIRGKDFYAIWLEDRGLWSTDEQDLIDLVDDELRSFNEKNSEKYPSAKLLYLKNGDTKMIDKWHHYCKDQCRENAHELDNYLTFADTDVKKNDYVSKRLPYALKKGDISAYDRLISVLYSEEERRKIEWAIGSIISGDSVLKNQKFIVMYGEPKTGKSTVLNIIQQLFEGYWVPFDAKTLASNSNAFAMEAFRSNPLVAIQHDGDLSRIEDNTRLNSIVSHETMVINEKFKAAYPIRLKSFLFMGTNKPVKITDSKSGLLRRLIDVSPTGNKVPRREYDQLMHDISFELGAIAYHCLSVYKADPNFYDDYIPINMLGASNDFYNFVVENYYDFIEMEGISLKAAWERYRQYISDANVPYPMSQRIFKEEFKNYWEQFEDRYVMDDGTRIRSYYIGFRSDKFEKKKGKKHEVEIKDDEMSWIIFKKQPYSVFDVQMEDCPAQLASEEGIPMTRWSNCKTTLKSIDTSKLHYVKLPENHIVIDFDIPDESGNKSLSKNLEAASKWPATYAELSKSGAGIHLHYIYNGDVDKLADHVDEHVEVKVFKGNSSLRRKLSLCTALAIATISSGLPLRKEKKVVSERRAIKDEKSLRLMIQKNLDKEFHGDTSSSINFINKLLDDAYESGMKYDLTVLKDGEEKSLKDQIIIFAKGSSHQKDRCLKVANAMKFKGKEEELATNKDILDYEKSLIEKIKSLLYSGDGRTPLKALKEIDELLKKEYKQGNSYDISSLKNRFVSFAQTASSNDAIECLNLVQGFKYLGKPNEAELYSSEGDYDDVKKPSKKGTDGAIVFFDVEVFPNLFVLCWKKFGDKKVNQWINPTAEQVEGLLKYKLVGFNCRRYDNHILYAKIMGFTNEELYRLSQKIIKGEKNCFFGEAYNLSYTDIYDFANGDNKTSLKKLEIKMGILHDELGVPWDIEVPEWAIVKNGNYIPVDVESLSEKDRNGEFVDEDGNAPINLWMRIAEYCCHDVEATESAFEYLEADWIARQILADITGMTVNDTSNSLTTRLIFGNERNTQAELNWRDLGDMSQAVDSDCPEIYDKEWTVFDAYGRPIFPGYKYEMGKSTYRDENPSEGGYVYAEPGMYTGVALLDIASMHPTSASKERLFGRFTDNFDDLLAARIAIKHEDWKAVEKMFGGKLIPYIQKVKDGEITSKQLANALKIPINSVYGLTSASFDNPFKDKRNVDNIVAKRGALFMINLKHEVQRKGFKVVHIKTDSIKIADATPEIIDFVMEYGKLYGYTFEHEATYDRMCLVNDAVYIAKYSDGAHKYELPTGEVVETPWTATGKEFAVPYIFKTLFSHDKVLFKDYCVTQSCTTALYLDMNEGYPDVTQAEKDWKKLSTKYKKGEISDTTWDKEAPILKEEIDKGHNYIFIGKVGSFVPVIDGCGGGILVREKDGKYYNASGSSGYRWKSAEVVKNLKKEDQVDISYWENQAHDAMGDIVTFGDFNWFVSDDPYVPPNYIHGDDMDYPDPDYYSDSLKDFINVPEVPENLPWE